MHLIIFAHKALGIKENINLKGSSLSSYKTISLVGAQSFWNEMRDILNDQHK